MKHKTEALAAFALMYILSEYEVDQELKDKVSALFTEVRSLTEDDDAVYIEQAIAHIEEYLKEQGV